VDVCTKIRTGFAEHLTFFHFITRSTYLNTAVFFKVYPNVLIDVVVWVCSMVQVCSLRYTLRQGLCLYLLVLFWWTTLMLGWGGLPEDHVNRWSKQFWNCYIWSILGLYDTRIKWFGHCWASHAVVQSPGWRPGLTWFKNILDFPSHHLNWFFRQLCAQGVMFIFSNFFKTTFLKSFLLSRI